MKRTIPCLLLFIIMVLTGCEQQSVNYPKRQMPADLHDDTAGLERATELFLHKCASCHGHPSEGRSERADFFQPPAPDFSEQKYRDIDPAYLFWRISEGKTVEPFRSRGSVMPAWGVHFSDREIWQLTRYLQKRADQGGQ
ncbi:MAG: hypothetical protein C0615_02145 [Desulfuromonas sp.]|nr:MAG: hypothetical protein C0615_02145 [Desulfuromonas sp.]